VPYITIVLGVILTLMGLWGYFGLGSGSITALIPAFFGVPFILLGVVALKESLLKHAMHAAAALAVLGLLGTIRGVFSFFKMMGGEEVARPDAVRVQAIMALLCAIFIALAVNSFIQARRNRARA
jgi:hypothetical protein